MIYINHTNLTGKDSPLKYMFTCLGVALAVFLTVAHILEYTLRSEGPDFSSALFHVHYCLQVSSNPRGTVIEVLLISFEKFLLQFLSCLVAQEVSNCSMFQQPMELSG